MWSLFLLALVPLVLGKVPTPTRGPRPTGAPCGGFLGIPCEGAGEVCIDDPSDDCDPAHGGADCIGVCVPGPPPRCGGFAGIKCPSSEYICVDDPSDSCDPKKGGADCIGICVRRTVDSRNPGPPPTGGAACGGFLGTPCKGVGEVCIDNPYDDCDSKHGGADCSGICVHKRSIKKRSLVPTSKPTSPRPTGAPCGGFAGIPCEDPAEVCVDDPSDDCDPKHGGADCIGVCVPLEPPFTSTTTSPPKPTGTPCGGFPGTPCKGLGEICVDDPGDDCDPKHGGADCIGVCVPGPPPTCGGFTGKSCPSKQWVCIDNPNDSCDPNNGGADCPGICVPRPKGPSCGGITGKPCPSKEYVCVDDPRDNCDPKKGGSDCIGICVSLKFPASPCGDCS